MTIIITTVVVSLLELPETLMINGVEYKRAWKHL